MKNKHCCKDCADRHESCHSTCERYLEFKRECEKARENRKVEIMYKDVVMQNKDACRRSHKTYRTF